MTVMDAATKQRKDALKRANEVRIAKANLKRRLKDSEENASEVIRNPPWYMANTPILELLMAVPQVGRVRASRWLNRAGISPARPISQLTPREMDYLADCIDGYKWSPAWALV